MELRIRPAQPGDVDLIYGWIVELAEYERARDQVRGTPELLEHALFGDHPSAEGLIAETQADEDLWQPAGFAVFHSTFSTWECRPGIWLEDLYIPPAGRRVGVGGAFLPLTWPRSRSRAGTPAWSGRRSTGTRRRSTSTTSSAPRDSTIGRSTGSTATRWRRSPVGHGRQIDVRARRGNRSAANDRAPMDSHRGHRVRRTSHPYRAAAAAGRRAAPWIDQREFEDAIAASNLLPGPASTQLAMFLARRVAGPRGAIVGGLCFILPAVTLIMALSVVFLATPLPCRSAAPGRGGGRRLLPSRCAPAPTWPARARAGRLPGSLAGLRRARRRRCCRSSGAYVVLVLLGCGVAELGCREGRFGRGVPAWAPIVALIASVWRRRRPWRTRLGGVQGRRAVLRGRVRDRAADAGRRRAHLPLDDLVPLPRCGRARSGDSRTGRRDGRGGRVRGPRRTGAALAAAVAFAPSFAFVLLWAGTSSVYGRARAHRRSSTVPARPRSARSWAPRSRWRRPSASRGNSRSSPPLRSRSYSPGAGSWSRCSGPGSSGRLPPWPARRCRDEPGCPRGP